jgi:hypothetical protein
MNKEFIPYEQALALKKLGFDEPCFAYYNIDPQLKTPAFNIVKPFEHEWCLPAPLYQQAFRWFRNKYGYLHHITYFDPYKAQTPGNADYQGFVLFPHGEIHKLPEMSYDTYEEAELACLKKLIEIVKK